MSFHRRQILLRKMLPQAGYFFSKKAACRGREFCPVIRPSGKPTIPLRRGPCWLETGMKNRGRATARKGKFQPAKRARQCSAKLAACGNYLASAPDFPPCVAGACTVWKSDVAAARFRGRVSTVWKRIHTKTACRPCLCGYPGSRTARRVWRADGGGLASPAAKRRRQRKGHKGRRHTDALRGSVCPA